MPTERWLRTRAAICSANQVTLCCLLQTRAGNHSKSTQHLQDSHTKSSKIPIVTKLERRHNGTRTILLLPSFIYVYVHICISLNNGAQVQKCDSLFQTICCLMMTLSVIENVIFAWSEHVCACSHRYCRMRRNGSRSGTAGCDITGFHFLSHGHTTAVHCRADSHMPASFFLQAPNPIHC